MSRDDADQSLINASKFLLNHFFKMYGLEVSLSTTLNFSEKASVTCIYTRVNHTLTISHDLLSIQTCCSMLAIAVAVRIDIYGIFYAMVLGLLMLVPRPPSKVHLWHLLCHGTRPVDACATPTQQGPSMASSMPWYSAC